MTSGAYRSSGWREVVAAQLRREAPNDLIVVSPPTGMGPLAYYRPELRDSDWYAIKANAQPQQIHRAIERRWRERRASHPGSRLWIVLRMQGNNQDSLTRMLIRMSRRYGPPAIDERYANLRLIRFDPVR